MWSFLLEADTCMFLFVCIYLYCRLKSNYQRVGVDIQLTGLTPPHVSACPYPAPGYVVFIVFSCLRWEVVFCCVDIHGIVYHHCLNFSLSENEFKQLLKKNV